MSAPIGSLAKHNLICVEIDAPLVEAYSLMRQRKIRHLPVKDGAQVIGLISDRDVQRGVRTEIFALEGRELVDAKIPEELRVRQFMSWPLKTIDANLSIKEVTRRMVREKVSSYLVTDGADVVGIVTHEDLLVYLESLLSEEGNQSSFVNKVRALVATSPIRLLSDTLANTGI